MFYRVPDTPEINESLILTLDSRLFPENREISGEVGLLEVYLPFAHYTEALFCDTCIAAYLTKISLARDTLEQCPHWLVHNCGDAPEYSFFSIFIGDMIFEMG